MNFKDLEVLEKLINALEKQNISKPTHAQELLIPKILLGENIILQSQTGSGKTLAYLLPIFQKYEEIKTLSAIILVPTRELAMQIHAQILLLNKNAGTNIKSCPLFGDVNIKKQIENLKEKPQIIIGTHSRILELIEKKKITSHTVKTLIIDEADKMLDKQNFDGSLAVRKKLMRDTQVILTSASISNKTLTLAKQISTNIQILKSELCVPTGIAHQYIVCDFRDKLEILRKLLLILKPQKSIIFNNRLEEIMRSTENLNYHKIDTRCLHGESSKIERQKNIADFKSGALKNLIATDIAARGLHIDNIDVVLSLSINEDATDYLHRSGRAGRNGNTGLSISIVAPEEVYILREYQKKLKIEMTEIRMYEGKIVSVAPQN